MATNQCEFYGPATYPDVYLIGMKLPKIGRTSLTYQLAMFPMVDASSSIDANMTHGYFHNELSQSLSDQFKDSASCVGSSVHVFVDPSQGNKPTPIPDEWRTTLERLQ